MFHDFLDRMLLFSKSHSIEKLICFVVSILVALGCSILAFCTTDRVPATWKDFNELHEQLLSIQEHPEEILKHNGIIVINDDGIFYTIENRKCKVTGEYTREFQLVDSSQEDKTFSTFKTIFGTLLLGGFVFFLVYVSLYVIIFIVELLVISVILLMKKLKGRH